MPGCLKIGELISISNPAALKQRSPIWKETMRDLLFKNLTSQDRRKRIIASLEITDDGGVRSIIRRHFICLVREISPKHQGERINKVAPCVYILRQENSKEQKKKFLCRIKGSVYAVNKGRLFLILFTHSLKINLVPLKVDFGEALD